MVKNAWKPKGCLPLFVFFGGGIPFKTRPNAWAEIAGKWQPDPLDGLPISRQARQQPTKAANASCRQVAKLTWHGCHKGGNQRQAPQKYPLGAFLTSGKALLTPKQRELASEKEPGTKKTPATKKETTREGKKQGPQRLPSKTPKPKKDPSEKRGWGGFRGIRPRTAPGRRPWREPWRERSTGSSSPASWARPRPGSTRKEADCPCSRKSGLHVKRVGLDFVSQETARRPRHLVLLSLRQRDGGNLAPKRLFSQPRDHDHRHCSADMVAVYHVNHIFAHGEGALAVYSIPSWRTVLPCRPTTSRKAATATMPMCSA